MKLTFSLSPNTLDIEAVRMARPPRLLISFSRWGNKNIKRDLIDRIGYKPASIVVDSGAFTFAFSKTRRKTPEQIGIFLTGCSCREELRSRISMDAIRGEPVFITYLRWIHANREFIDHAFAMDIIGDPFASLQAFKMMQSLGMPVIPIYHLGSPESYFENYLRRSPEFIALGGAAIGPNGKANNITARAKWASNIIRRYPWIKFHMMGTIDQRLINQLPGLYSADGSAWVVHGQLFETIQNIHKKLAA